MLMCPHGDVSPQDLILSRATNSRPKIYISPDPFGVHNYCSHTRITFSIFLIVLFSTSDLLFHDRIFEVFDKKVGGGGG